MQVKPLELLEVMKEYCSDCIIQGQGSRGKSITVFRLSFDKEKFQEFLKDHLDPQIEHLAYVINLQGIDIISPSAANALITSIVEISKQRKVPIIFIGVSAEALQGLQTIRNILQSEKVLWAVDVEDCKHLVGILPDRLQDILNILKEKGEASASDLAEQRGGESSKKNINRFSVYLQELYNTGLVIREKIAGSNRADVERERGWTYMYRPAYSVLTSTASI